MFERIVKDLRGAVYQLGVEVEARFEVALDEHFIKDRVVSRATLTRAGRRQVALSPPSRDGDITRRVTELLRR